MAEQKPTTSRKELIALWVLTALPVLASCGAMYVAYSIGIPWPHYYGLALALIFMGIRLFIRSNSLAPIWAAFIGVLALTGAAQMALKYLPQ